MFHEKLERNTAIKGKKVRQEVERDNRDREKRRDREMKKRRNK